MTMTTPRMMAGFLAGGLTLAGCVQTATTSGSSNGADAADQFRSFASDVAVAETVAAGCPTLGMRASTEALVQSFVDQLIAAGYTPEQLIAAQQATSADAIATDAADALTVAGVSEDDPQSFCTYGEGQMTAQTRIGSFLA